MKIFMKAGDRVYLNGANIQVDRKVSIELLNRTKFLLHDHVLAANDADTPLKQLYFAVQLMIINSNADDEAKKLYRNLIRSLMLNNNSPQIRRLVHEIDREVAAEREFRALKAIREKIAVEG